MMMREGGKLWRRKPSVAPASAASTKVAAALSSNWADTASRLMLVMKPTPPAKPSTPSMRLTAFVMPMIQNRVMMMDKAWARSPPNSTSMRMPVLIRSSAAMSCTARRNSGGSPNWSSMKPAMIISEPPSKMARTWICTSSMPMERRLVTITRDTITAAKMASPPALGRGSLLSRRGLGSSAQPTRRENRRTRGMDHHAAMTAMMKVRSTVAQPHRLGAAMPSALRKSMMVSRTGALYPGSLRRPERHDSAVSRCPAPDAHDSAASTPREDTVQSGNGNRPVGRHEWRGRSA